MSTAQRDFAPDKRRDPRGAKLIYGSIEPKRSLLAVIRIRIYRFLDALKARKQWG